jgi:methylmalonyl-CoA/ethylmalonyl-CoA epimerase
MGAAVATQSRAPFADASVRTISFVVPDAEKFARAWADVLGAEMPPIREYPGLIFPEGYDSSAYPRIANLRMANVSISMHHPVGGRSYWKELLDTHGPALYRMNFSVRGLPDTVATLQGLGGKLVVGGPTTGGLNVNLWPKYGFAVELGVAARPPAAAATAPAATAAKPSAPAPPPATGFAANPVFKVAFVVPDIQRATADYADLFGVARPAVTERTVSESSKTGAKPHTTKLKTAMLDLPGDIDLELNEPPAGDNRWRQHMQKHGGRALFSVGVHVSNVEEQASYLTGKGGVLVAGGAGAPYAVVDMIDRLGTIIEVHAAP